MCGRYVIPAEDAVARWCPAPLRWGYRWLRAIFNVAPTTEVPILLSDAAENTWATQKARWGLIPSWWQREAPPAHAINARMEDVAAKPMWRESFRAARCLIPAQGWYEWQATHEPGRPPRQPFYIHSPEADVLAFAGLYATHTTADGAMLTSCAILTKDSAPSIAHIHPRMPIVLPKERLQTWLAPNAREEQLFDLLAQAQADFASHPVSTRVNSIHHEGPELIAKISIANTGLLDFGP